MKKLFSMLMFLGVIICLHPIVIHAQVVSPSPVASISPVPSPASGGVVGVVSVLGIVTAWILAHLVLVGGSAGATILEFVLRLIPSVKPLSLLTPLSLLFHAVGDLINALNKALDSLIQNVKP